MREIKSDTGRAALRRWTSGAALHGLLLLGTVITLAPYVWMVSSSFKPNVEIFSATLELIPARPILDNYVTALTREPTLRAIGNSLIMAGGETLAVVVTSIFTAYPFARLRFRGR
ncbi:MAG TPA: carbohydrate ABC transporter permease, partial [Candidatus Methylomirabilis sp.]|nr:carbohydrate ABC transporter permease [Candidatus Methylomirabilis sp.]